jgi:hypothetical protein
MGIAARIRGAVATAGLLAASPFLTATPAAAYSNTDIQEAPIGDVVNIEYNANDYKVIDGLGSEPIVGENPWTVPLARHQWELRPAGSVAGTQYFEIRSRLTGGCLDAEGGGSHIADGTRVISWFCHGGDNQKWSFEREGASTRISNKLPAPDGNGSHLTYHHNGWGMTLNRELTTDAARQVWKTPRSEYRFATARKFFKGHTGATDSAGYNCKDGYSFKATDSRLVVDDSLGEVRNSGDNAVFADLWPQGAVVHYYSPVDYYVYGQVWLTCLPV